jgi:diguanylate cyclase (GGDEF)-like protein
MTVSIGVSSYPNDANDPDKLMALADEALYKAKSAGRNAVVLAQ